MSFNFHNHDTLHHLQHLFLFLLDSSPKELFDWHDWHEVVFIVLCCLYQYSVLKSLDQIIAQYRCAMGMHLFEKGFIVDDRAIHFYSMFLK
jgi:hypothetical protein